MRKFPLIALAFFSSLSFTVRAFFPVQLAPGDLASMPYAATGYVDSRVGQSWFSGSGAVARDASLLYTCAHVLYDKGRWADAVAFHRAWHSQYAPSDFGAVWARGYHYLAGYADNFDKDFAVAYASPAQQFGVPLGWYSDGATPLATAAPKMIVGYPAELDIDRSSGFYFQHRTGPFNESFFRLAGSWHEVAGVSTGDGNSGGPVLVWDGSSYRLAGVLVSGAFDRGVHYAGIYALDAAAELAATSALASAEQPELPPSVSPAGTTRVASNSKAAALKDGARRFTVRRMTIPRRAGASITGVNLDLSVSAERRGDLDVFLRSPRGRTYVVAAANPADNDANLLLTNADISGPFLGSNPRGGWRIFLRDSVVGGASRFQRAALRVASE
jgi:subtilisin-like proprotein convertase family protein